MEHDIFCFCSLSHRLIHHPLLYKHIHKKHHEWTAPVGIVSIYAHPIEHVVSSNSKWTALSTSAKTFKGRKGPQMHWGLEVQLQQPRGSKTGTQDQLLWEQQVYANPMPSCSLERVTQAFWALSWKCGEGGCCHPVKSLFWSDWSRITHTPLPSSLPRCLASTLTQTGQKEAGSEIFLSWNTRKGGWGSDNKVGVGLELVHARYTCLKQEEGCS